MVESSTCVAVQMGSLCHDPFSLPAAYCWCHSSNCGEGGMCHLLPSSIRKPVRCRSLTPCTLGQPGAAHPWPARGDPCRDPRRKRLAGAAGGQREGNAFEADGHSVGKCGTHRPGRPGDLPVPASIPLRGSPLPQPAAPQPPGISKAAHEEVVEPPAAQTGSKFSPRTRRRIELLR